VKDYSPAVNPFSTKKQSELEKKQFRDFYCLDLIYYRCAVQKAVLLNNQRLLSGNYQKLMNSLK